MKNGLIFLLFINALTSSVSHAAPDLSRIQLPDGFEISIYAEGVENARQMVLGDGGTLFVGSRRAGNVYTITDSDQDQRADRVRVFEGNLDMPSGLAFRDGSLYVGDLTRIYRYDDVENQLDNPLEPTTIIDNLPGGHHKWKYLEFGPEGWLYVPVGAPCNICNEFGHAQLRRIRPDGSGMELFADGVRNTVGLAFHPETGELWFSENGRDHMGDDLPADEINHAPKPGLHFGYPFCHQGDTPDPEFGSRRQCSEFEPPAVKLGAHVAPLGLTFYQGEMFPEEYRGQLFVAEHGSWNRSEKSGYAIRLVKFDEDGRPSGQEVFAQGWLRNEESWGRPADVFEMPDGALLVSDDRADAIYRISYSPEN